jgi:hypothetical protein
LIWIKNRPEWMTHPAGMSPARPKIDTCPICGVAIEGSKSHVQAADFDFFECLTCHRASSSVPPRLSGAATMGNDTPPRKAARERVKRV